MYMTRPLSLYRKDATALANQLPDDTAHLGWLVVSDEETEEQDTFCCGSCHYKNIKTLPFPQNKILSIVHNNDESGFRDYSSSNVTKVWFLPVLNQALSSHRYYIIQAAGRYKGRACASSRMSDMCSCCYKDFIADVKPRHFDHRDNYQQFEIHHYHGSGFYAKSVARDGIPPRFLRRKGWKIRISKSIQAKLKDALGLDCTVRAALPLAAPCNSTQSQMAVVEVGKWYCPFIFVHEEAKLWRHMKKSMFYEITLLQYWEQIFYRENNSNEDGNANDSDNDPGRVIVDARIQREEALVYGMEVVKEVQLALGRV